MDDSAKSGAGLEVSVSFGRFENDALSWEKWSSFSPNKYLEEVGTLSTPGSVAQKKAYFEAHYKKIAAKKAEEMELEKSMSPLSPSPNMSSKEDFLENSSENSTESGSFNDERLVQEAAEEEACVTDLTKVVIASEEKDSAISSKEDDEGASVNGVVDNIAPEEETSASVAAESVVQEAKDVKNVGVDSHDSNVCKETPRRLWERPQETKKGVKGVKQLSVLKKENSKTNTRNIAQKVTPINKERNVPTTRKKVVTPPSKPLPAATPKYMKPASIASPMSVSQSMRKKVNNSAPSKMKSSQAGQSKRVAPTSLHMSLSLGPADSLGALPMRKSLIMESMGDKDIVKRAFKSFQNRTNGFAPDEKEKPTAVKHLSTAASEPKRSSYNTPTKSNEGLKKEAEKRASQRKLSGTRSNPLPTTGLRKSTALEKKTPTISSPATGLRSDEKAERRREFIKKLGAKSIAREAENAQHAAKAKAGVENETRQRPSTNR